MSWSQIQNHDSVVDRFRQTVKRNRLASTYLFVGPDSIGKRMFAYKLAEALLCETNPNGQLDPCGICSGCIQVQARSHPDLIMVSKPPDKAFIPVELFIGPKEKRRRVGLIHDMGLKPFRGNRKIAIIEDADFLNQEGANSLLKTLEEPPPNSMLILIGTSQQRQLSTILSRSQIVRFNPLTNQQVLSILEASQEFESDVPLKVLAAAAEGSVERAIQLSNPDMFEFRKTLWDRLASLDPQQRGFSKVIIDCLNSAGKDGAKKRARLVLVGDFAIAFYRNWYLELSGQFLETTGENSFMDGAVKTATAAWVEDVSTGMEVAAQCILSCTQMQKNVSTFSNASNNIEHWLCELGRICQRGLALA